ncbi:hypothetical protein [Chryseobacterium carnipullorum]|uniref:hypothetical protein n=1 Tax=Chryseobacterium carnipullorum TaxID=1124835 RepID=UPI000E7E126F|nr:hypothetical protein [Chryseobacterium carnipullorum]HBV14511.1 hypothetical protein [Chryseobacterium carnipullorum]
MNKFIIYIDKNSIFKHKNNITGNIYFNFDGFFFPERNWNDFIIIIINNWINSSYNILSGYTKYEELYFMDGPFHMKVRKIDSEVCVIELVENHTNILLSYRISAKDLFEEILRNVNLLSKYCTEQDWETDEIRKLQYLNTKFSTIF